MRETEENPKQRLTPRRWFAVLAFFVVTAAALAMWKYFGPVCRSSRRQIWRRPQKRWEAAAATMTDYDLTWYSQVDKPAN